MLLSGHSGEVYTLGSFILAGTRWLALGMRIQECQRDERSLHGHCAALLQHRVGYHLHCQYWQDYGGVQLGGCRGTLASKIKLIMLDWTGIVRKRWFSREGVGQKEGNLCPAWAVHIRPLLFISVRTPPRWCPLASTMTIRGLRKKPQWW